MSSRPADKRKRSAPPRAPGEPPRPPAPIGRVLLTMIQRGDARALILAEYELELAAFLRAEENARRGGAPVHVQLAKRYERIAYFDL